MLELGTDEFAKYPFLEGAGKILKDKGFPLSQFGTDPDLEPVVKKALHRLKVSTQGGIYKSDITNIKYKKGEYVPLWVFGVVVVGGYFAYKKFKK